MPILALFKNSAILGNFSKKFENIFCMSKMDIHTNFCDNSFKIDLVVISFDNFHETSNILKKYLNICIKLTYLLCSGVFCMY